jgi:hypothetical protein
MTDFDPRIPPERDLPTGRLEQRHAHLIREARGLPRRRRRTMLILVPAAAVLAAGAALAAGLFGGHVTETDRIECYERADLKSRHTPVVLSLEPSVDEQGKRRSLGPTALCERFFVRGFFASQTGQPHLVGCLRGGRVLVFPGGTPATCNRLGLQHYPDSSWRTEVRLIGRAVEVADRAIEQEQGRQGQLYFGVGVCAHARPMLPRVRRALEARGLDDFKVVLAHGVRPSACLEDFSSLAQTPDGRTIELNTLASSGMRGGDTRTPAQKRAQAQRERHLCDHPEGRDGAHSIEDVTRAVDCARKRHEPYSCFRPRFIKHLLERVLRREGFRGWEVLLDSERPDARRQYLAGFGVDQRLRQLSISFASSCDWRYERRRKRKP